MGDPANEYCVSDLREVSDLHVVIGGCGYPGHHLSIGLLKRGHRVKVVDVIEASYDLPKGVTYVKCDIRDEHAVEQALRGAFCVYHLASYGMSGTEQLQVDTIHQVNVIGTENIIKACQRLNIQYLVYTSTYNVVFGGQSVENGDESLPYFPLEKHVDHYSRTKAIAEMRVLESNGSMTSDGHLLYTCALRLGAVYGPGERRHLPRVVSLLKSGLFCARFDKKGAMTDFLHIDNLVQAHIKAGEALTPNRNHTAITPIFEAGFPRESGTQAGQAYFISDGKPINNFEFFKPLVEGLGYSFPKISLPFYLVYFIAFLIEKIVNLLSPVYKVGPLLTRAEVNKMGVLHYFNIAKAKEQLNYEPTRENDLQGVTEWFIERGHRKKKQATSALMRFVLNISLAVLLAAFLFSLLPCVM